MLLGPRWGPAAALSSSSTDQVAQHAPCRICNADLLAVKARVVAAVCASRRPPKGRQAGCWCVPPGFQQGGSADVAGKVHVAQHGAFHQVRLGINRDTSCLPCATAHTTAITQPTKQRCQYLGALQHQHYLPSLSNSPAPCNAILSSASCCDLTGLM